MYAGVRVIIARTNQHAPHSSPTRPLEETVGFTTVSKCQRTFRYLTVGAVVHPTTLAPVTAPYKSLKAWVLSRRNLRPLTQLLWQLVLVLGLLCTATPRLIYGY
jgi:hypothetical protein